jgi:hypothetical protein
LYQQSDPEIKIRKPFKNDYMSTHLLRIVCIIFLATSCVAPSRNSNNVSNVNTETADLSLPATLTPDSLTNLDRTPEGGFVLAPGFYQATYKTYCLQPGTPDPTPGNAYVHAPVSGYRKDIVQSVLYSSRSNSYIEQRNVQLLLWSVVSGSDYNKLSPGVKMDAERLLTQKQIFELKGGVMGLIKELSNNIPANSVGVKKLFEMGTSSYEAYEKIAVINEPAKEFRADFKYDQWYKQGNYFVRYFPESYKRVKIQVYVPADLPTDEYTVFDPTGSQVIPANSNAQRLGIGGVLVDVIKKVIIINKKDRPKTQPKTSEKEPEPKAKPLPGAKNI